MMTQRGAQVWWGSVWFRDKAGPCFTWNLTCVPSVVLCDSWNPVGIKRHSNWQLGDCDTCFHVHDDSQHAMAAALQQIKKCDNDKQNANIPRA
jgi:hypothetical protein